MKNLSTGLHLCSYPLSPIPLSLCCADGGRRETSKSKLLDLIINEGSVTLTDPKKEIRNIQQNSSFVIDLIAALRSLVPFPETYDELRHGNC